ncbi:MAG: transposase family protein [Gemmatimonadetes bacterium]|nr:transposase family protein [Gemmatimonadota bacterium]
MDFIHDECVSGRRFRCLTMVDECTRECPPTLVDTSLRAGRVIETLYHLAAARGLPRSLIVDHGPEFVSMALDRGAYGLGGHLHSIQPGKPTQKAYIESFHSRFRDECLSAHWFESLSQKRRSYVKLMAQWVEGGGDAKCSARGEASQPGTPG